MRCKARRVTYLVLYLIVSHTGGFSSPSRASKGCRISNRLYPFHQTKTPSDDSLDDDEEAVDLASVSDSEALLACRAYLQRKNLLGGWEGHARRKRRSRQASAQTSSTFAAAGYFWEDPSELKYMHNSPPHLQDPFIEDNEEEIDDLDLIGQDGKSSSERVVFDDSHSAPNEDDEYLSATSALERGGAFTSFPIAPSDEQERRSEAAKKTWSDPEFREKWYAKRWGTRKQTKDQKQEKKMEDRMSSLPAGILSSPELASLSQDEITEAIRTYVAGNRKRSRARRAKNEKSPDSSPDPALPPKKSLLETFGSEDSLREAQKRRSERATKAYQTRLQNAADSQPKRRRRSSSSIGHELPPTGDTPREAVVRIQADLESKQLPRISDVELLLAPRKLGRRKEILRRMLNELFDLRGKCVPANIVNEAQDGEEKLFVTQCKVEELGAFVLFKLKQAMEQNDKDLK